MENLDITWDCIDYSDSDSVLIILFNYIKK